MPRSSARTESSASSTIQAGAIGTEAGAIGTDLLILDGCLTAHVGVAFSTDKNTGDADAQEKFHKVARAYEILSDEQKRQVYDLEGIEGLERDEKGGHSHSPFDSFFGGGGKPHGPDAAMDLSVTLEELYNGAQKTVQFTRNVICRKCRGTGAKDGKVRRVRSHYPRRVWF
jgi:DnaJ-class molecular chaperone